jgi:hypothetical protein
MRWERTIDDRKRMTCCNEVEGARGRPRWATGKGRGREEEEGKKEDRQRWRFALAVSQPVPVGNSRSGTYGSGHRPHHRFWMCCRGYVGK